MLRHERLVREHEAMESRREVVPFVGASVDGRRRPVRGSSIRRLPARCKSWCHPALLVAALLAVAWVDASDAGTPVADPALEDGLYVADVWAGHHVEFALVTDGDMQFVAHYDVDRNMTIAARSLDSEEWDTATLPSVVGWDSHNNIAMAVDSEGHLHVSGNMHGDPLVYFRSQIPHDIHSFEDLGEMVGESEARCTYPTFFNGPSGDLVFSYRSGGSGNGNTFFNIYDVESKGWTRLIDEPLTDGEGLRNAYHIGPTLGPDGFWHLVWVWRDTPDAATNHDISYARSRDLLTWENGRGDAVALPFTLRESEILDPVPILSGMINGNTKVGFDSENRPIISYHKYDQDGNTQIYNARVEGGEWVITQATSWNFRWDFGGTGTLSFEVELDGVRPDGEGLLRQDFFQTELGNRSLLIDESTLEAVDTVDQKPPLFPAGLYDVESEWPVMMEVHWAGDTGSGGDDNLIYMLRWEALPSNRDMPRDSIPPPTPLRLYAVPEPRFAHEAAILALATLWIARRRIGHRSRLSGRGSRRCIATSATTAHSRS
jgi:hypothetical protein